MMAAQDFARDMLKQVAQCDGIAPGTGLMSVSARLL